MRSMTWQILGLVALSLLVDSCGPRAVKSHRVTPLEVRLASSESQPGWISMQAEDTRETIYVSPDVTLSNGDVADAKLVYGPDGEPWVAIHLNEISRQRFAEFTSTHIGSRMAIVIASKLMAIPTIRDVVTDGRAMIVGQFTDEEAQTLAGSIVPMK